MMYKIFVFFISFLPGLLWLRYFYRKDKYEPEPKRFIAKCFVFGIVSVFPAGLLEQFLEAFLTTEAMLSTSFIKMFLIVGPVEEFMKFAFMWLAVSKTHELNDRIDGFVYAGAVALGFASIENFFYLKKFGASLILVRGPISTLAHVLFSSYWGLAFAEVKLDVKKKKACVLALVLAAFLHGLFNFVLSIKLGLGVIAVFPLMMWMWRKTAGNIQDANIRSFFKPANRVQCPVCKKYYYIKQKQCPYCRAEAKA